MENSMDFIDEFCSGKYKNKKSYKYNIENYKKYKKLSISTLKIDETLSDIECDNID